LFVGVVNIVMGVGVMGVVLVDYDGVDKIVFIGFIDVGKWIVWVVVGGCKKVIFELGGKGVNIVYDDVLFD